MVHSQLHAVRARLDPSGYQVPLDYETHLGRLAATVREALDDFSRDQVQTAIREYVSDAANRVEAAVDGTRSRAHARLLALADWAEREGLVSSAKEFAKAVAFCGALYFGVQFTVGFLKGLLDPFITGIEEGIDDAFDELGPQTASSDQWRQDLGGTPEKEYRYDLEYLKENADTPEERGELADQLEEIADRGAAAYDLDEEYVADKEQEYYIGSEGIGPIDTSDEARSEWLSETDANVGAPDPKEAWDDLFRFQNPTDQDRHEDEMDDVWEDMDDWR